MRKRITGAAGLIAAAFLLAACGSDDAGSTDGADGEAPPADSDRTYVALVSKGFQHQFWQSVRDGAQQAADEFDVDITFEGPDSESEVAQQIDMLQTAIDRSPDALGFAALDSQAAAPLMDQAASSDIPVIAFDSGVDSDVPLATAATDNRAAAALAAENMVELIGGSGQVAMVVHDQTSVTGTERRDGFVEYIEQNAPDVEIVDIQYGRGDHLESTNVATAIIQGNPDLDGIYGSNEGSAIGVVNAVQELGIAGDLVIVGFDSGQAQMDAIRDGVMAGAITQNPVGIGYETVKAAVEALNGDELPETIDTGFFWYDETNIDDDEIQAVLYE
jgi:ribose transport system substrate-binding protein